MSKNTNTTSGTVSAEVVPTPFFLPGDSKPLGFQFPQIHPNISSERDRMEQSHTVVDGFKGRNRPMTVEKPTENYGKKETLNDIEFFLAPHLGKYCNLWDKPHITTYTLKLSGDTDLFSKLKCLSQESHGLAIVPQLEGSLSSKQVITDFVDNTDFCLAALDNLPLSVSISKFVIALKRDLEAKISSRYQSELDTCKMQLEECRSKLVRNTDTSSAVLARQTKAQEFVEEILPVVHQIEETGIDTLQAIADKLNELGYKTRTGAEWTSTAVFRTKKLQSLKGQSVKALL
jgi:hypothetical protein